MALTVETNSFINLFDKINYDENRQEIWDIWNAFELNPEIKKDPDASFTVENGNGLRWDGLSEFAYNTREFWWLLTTINDIFNPFLLGRSELQDEASNPPEIRIIHADVLNNVVVGIRNRDNNDASQQ